MVYNTNITVIFNICTNSHVNNNTYYVIILAHMLSISVAVHGLPALRAWRDATARYAAVVTGDVRREYAIQRKIEASHTATSAPGQYSFVTELFVVIVLFNFIEYTFTLLVGIWFHWHWQSIGATCFSHQYISLHRSSRLHWDEIIERWLYWFSYIYILSENIRCFIQRLYATMQQWAIYSRP